MFLATLTNAILNVIAFTVVKFGILNNPKALIKLQKSSEIIIVCITIWLSITLIPTLILSYFVEWETHFVTFLVLSIVAVFVCTLNFALMEYNIFSLRRSKEGENGDGEAGEDGDRGGEDEEDVESNLNLDIIKSMFFDVLMFILVFMFVILALTSKEVYNAYTYSISLTTKPN